MNKKYSDELIQFIRDNAKGKSNLELTELVNKQFNCDLTIKNINSIKKNYHITSGLNGRFKKGNIPFNKGLKWTDYLSQESIDKLSKTCFTKENINNRRNHNWCELGDERIGKDNYIEVKTDVNVWEPKQRVIFERYYNVKIKPNEVVIFADGNIRNFNIENLILLSRGELLQMNRNNLIKQQAEATKCGVNLVKYIIKVNELKKGKQNGQLGN